MVIIGSYAQVMHGTADQTSGGLRKSDIKTVHKNDGSIRYVSKLKHKIGKTNPWIKALAIAREELGLSNAFVIINKKSKLYKLARKIYDEEM